MTKQIKRWLSVLLCLTLTFTTSACWDSNELDKLAIVVGVGIDKAEQDDMIELTTQIANVSGSGEKSSSDAKLEYVNVRSVGSDTTYIMRDFVRKLSRRPYLGHNRLILISCELASEGIRDYIDLFLRDPESRYTVKLVLTRNTAFDTMETKPHFEAFPTVKILSLLENLDMSATSVDVTLFDFLSAIVSVRRSAVAPIIALEGATGAEADNRIFLDGTAVFNEDMMVGELNLTETRGLLWVRGDVKQSAINVATPTGSAVVSSRRSQSSLTPVITDDGKLIMQIDIKVSAVLDSQTGTDNLADTESIAELETLAAEVIKSEISGCLYKAQILGEDIFGFAEKIYDHYPSQWNEMETNWDHIFRDIETELMVDVAISATGRMVRPARRDEG
ncbi:MAG: Ger(x)C family spore germination protein [Christensenellales bacterium]